MFRIIIKKHAVDKTAVKYFTFKKHISIEKCIISISVSSRGFMIDILGGPYISAAPSLT